MRAGRGNLPRFSAASLNYGQIFAQIPYGRLRRVVAINLRGAAQLKQRAGGLSKVKVPTRQLESMLRGH